MAHWLVDVQSVSRAIAALHFPGLPCVRSQYPSSLHISSRVQACSGSFLAAHLLVVLSQ